MAVPVGSNVVVVPVHGIQQLHGTAGPAEIRITFPISLHAHAFVGGTWAATTLAGAATPLTRTFGGTCTSLFTGYMSAHALTGAVAGAGMAAWADISAFFMNIAEICVGGVTREISSGCLFALENFDGCRVVCVLFLLDWNGKKILFF